MNERQFKGLCEQIGLNIEFAAEGFRKGGYTLGIDRLKKTIAIFEKKNAFGGPRSEDIFTINISGIKQASTKGIQAGYDVCNIIELSFHEYGRDRVSLAFKSQKARDQFYDRITALFESN